MGTGASVSTRSVQRLVEREVCNHKQHDEFTSRTMFMHNEDISRLQNEISDCKDRLRVTEMELKVCQRMLDKEQKKNISIFYSDVPLKLMEDTSDNLQLVKTYEMVTVAKCDVVDFSSLSTVLSAQETVTVINQIQTAIDKVFKHDNIFIMERHTDGCMVISGLLDIKMDETLTARKSATQTKTTTRTETPMSLTDSSYGSELRLTDTIARSNTESNSSTVPFWAVSHASVLAMAVLELMSLSASVHIPSKPGLSQQLQLRVAMNSGPCRGGMINLPVMTGATLMPHFKLFGKTIHDTVKLCSSGLALQIRVSEQCHRLLAEAGSFRFERCPDFVPIHSEQQDIVESYWLVGADDLEYPLPSLNKAVCLSNYDDLV